MNKKSEYINLNGEFYPDNAPIITSKNRAFRYGDALFETIRIINGKPFNLNAHFERLKKGLDLLQFDKTPNFTFRYLAEQIQLTIQKNNISEGGRLRLTVFRNEGGTYIPETNTKSFLIEVTPLHNNQFVLNEDGLSIDICKKFTLEKSIFSSIKTANALPFVMAGIEAKKQNLDNLILLNHNSRICEAISSNIFLYKNNTIYTPSLDEGCVAGTMRKKIIEIAHSLGMTVFECTLVQGNLQQVDEIWLSNAIQGIQWVKEISAKLYGNFYAQKIINELNKSTSD
jgi:branched-chain amino acid aminotransferase